VGVVGVGFGVLIRFFFFCCFLVWGFVDVCGVFVGWWGVFWVFFFRVVFYVLVWVGGGFVFCVFGFRGVFCVFFLCFFLFWCGFSKGLVFLYWLGGSYCWFWLFLLGIRTHRVHRLSQRDNLLTERTSGVYSGTQTSQPAHTLEGFVDGGHPVRTSLRRQMKELEVNWRTDA